MKPAILILLIALSGCSTVDYVADGETTFDLGVGQQTHVSNMLPATIYSKWLLCHGMQHFDVCYEHQSSLLDGGPFNDKDESSQDSFFIKARMVTIDWSQ